MAVALRSLADFLGTHGQLSEAMASLDEAEPLERRLYAIDPDDVHLGFGLSSMLFSRGELKERIGDQVGARAAYAESIAIDEELLAKGHQDGGLRLLLASTLMNLGLLEGHAGRVDEAARAYRRAFEIAKTIAPPDPSAAMAARITAVLSGVVPDRSAEPESGGAMDDARNDAR